MEIKEEKIDADKDYLMVLKAIKEIPFFAGKILLIDFLTGNIKNKSIKNNNLDALKSFNSLNLEKQEIKKIIDNLINNNLIEVISSETNRFLKLLKITLKGKNELLSPELYKKKLKNNFNNKQTIITEKDKLIFKELEGFLNSYNDEQKKAIISNKEKILCIAGAGSGKTTALTKRIEFLIKYKSVDPKKILAITFTRKAKQEMLDRLLRLGISTNVETFNSFCEKILKKHQNKIYNRQVTVMSYGNKAMALMSSLNTLNLKMSDAIENYFSESQRRNKKTEQLSNIFMNDCFLILDYFKSKNKELYDFSQDVDEKHIKNAKMIYNICNLLKEHMNLQGLRDYTDQMLDTLRFFKSNKEFIPYFEHILVDEYQDVNTMQVELLDLLKPKNFFCIGDPRQSIFGWRGSDVKHILKFHEKYPDNEIISLTKNYRSNNHIVDFMNLSIKDIGLPDIESTFEEKKQIKLLNFDSEQEELDFVINKILNSSLEKQEIFVLARTNRQLNELSGLMNKKQIPHIVKTDEINKPVFIRKGEVTLATIHSIKGLEAKMVFVIGCNELNFPCKASDHPVVEIIKIEEYDKEEEEKRLFYVAISRAKEKLYLTYTGKKPTYFINQEMLDMIES